MGETKGATYDDYVDRIHYSDRYSDETHEYRHVILPKGLMKLIPADYFEPGGQVLRLLTESEWRGIGSSNSAPSERRLPLKHTAHLVLIIYRHSAVARMGDLFGSRARATHCSSRSSPCSVWRLSLLFRREKDYQQKYAK
ncbi:regulatory subunit of cyclin-dependent kinase [Leucosporidium creatinivorum]|uniref:Cyclin-dependent kinases regulatory subunit n=1 Tax=Leucosporidium creatinivorum TaxID=106004 RepID=A0A1Y2DB20_9BASI|nr:regulatory subunit of cyclin-dependent kinase [Leucosporidium creatinivorum]